ncbi:hypothetical protein Kfla_4257 [Kribbella flavida DSM 17836]|uniref:Uncharacterized protein n=1 Tax=Kribbella flavida (strain DSM 17836 / JCM 10339 / NBRC 14399) TaxID=479435 RepID=D2PU10_KRIFD|nr:hypothetical protein [Kribbella flavida]ADB33293.1 hypothetical protein Kfla_4257 [Kribbella flavida DSM 17836]
MGVPLVIALVVIALAALGYVIFSLFAAGRGAAAAGQSLAGDHAPETAAHTDERTKSRSVDTTPPDDSDSGAGRS